MLTLRSINTAARRSIPGFMRCNPKTSIRRPTSKARGIPLAVYSCEYTPCFAAARVAVGRGPYFVNVLRILRPANSLQKSPPSISFQNPPPRQLSVLNSLLCVQPSPSGFRAEFFTVCPVWSIELSGECLKESLPPPEGTNRTRGNISTNKAGRK